MSATFADPILVHLHDAHTRTVWMRSWAAEDTPVGRGLIRCSLTDLSGSGVFDIATGYGKTKGLTEWQLTKRSQDELIAWAATQGREIQPRRRPAPKAKARRKAKPNKNQTGMDWE